LETPQQQKKDESTAIAVEANKDIAENKVFDGNRKRKLSESAEDKPAHAAAIKTNHGQRRRWRYTAEYSF